MKPLRSAAVAAVLNIAASLAVVHAGSAVAHVNWSAAHPVTLDMIDYEFVPNELRIRHGLPYRLHLRNEGHEGHDFTAPDFFGSVKVKESAAFNESRTSVFLRPSQQAEIYFVAPDPGIFDLRCADHDWSGMTATIIVE